LLIFMRHRVRHKPHEPLMRTNHEIHEYRGTHVIATALAASPLPKAPGKIKLTTLSRIRYDMGNQYWIPLLVTLRWQKVYRLKY
jgi:hypothetical protein